MASSMSHCSRCHTLFNTKMKGAWIEIKGWTVNRAKGGANAIRDRHETGHVLCPRCGKDREMGVIPGQAIMFEEGVPT